LLLITVLAAVIGVAAACGGGSTTKAASSPTTAAGGSASAYISCLESHGYTPSAAQIQRLQHPPTTDANGGGGGFGGGFGGGAGGGPGGGAGTTRSTISAAQQQVRQQATTACQSQAPAGARAFGGGGGPGGAQFLTSLRAYISCLNDHGYTAVTVPPTTVAGQTQTSGQGQSLRQALQSIQSDPAAASARTACAAILPAFPGRGGSTSTTLATS
jgi:hypothetical protein